MRFNKWVIFIKKSRNWYANKYQSIDYCLIKKYNDNNDDNDDNDSVNKAKTMNFF